MGIILVDADSIYFRAAYKKKKSDIRKTINSVMKDIQTCSFCDEMKVAVKGTGNFRYNVYPEYKGNRKRDYDPDFREFLNYGHKYMEDRWEAVRADNMEADDLVSIWAYECRDMDIPYVIAGIDKDLRQIPGTHYNYSRQEFEDIDLDSAYRNLMEQCLIGDAGDNIPGIPKIGPVRAKRILRDIPPHLLYDTVRDTWRAHGVSGLDVSYRLLAMIKTWEEFDGIQAECETILSQQHVLPKQEEDSDISRISKRDTRRSNGDRMESQDRSSEVQDRSRIQQ